MRIPVGIEDVGHAELAERDHQPIRCLRSCELVDTRFNLLLLAAEVDRLPQEQARDPGIGRRVADLVGLSAWESSSAERTAQSEALVYLRVHPQFRAVPEPRAGVEGHVPGLTALVGDEAVLSPIG